MFKEFSNRINRLEVLRRAVKEPLGRNQMLYLVLQLQNDSILHTKKKSLLIQTTGEMISNKYQILLGTNIIADKWLIINHPSFLSLHTKVSQFQDYSLLCDIISESVLSLHLGVGM